MHGEKDRPLTSIALFASAAVATVFAVGLFAVDKRPRAHPYRVGSFVTAHAVAERWKSAPPPPERSHEQRAVAIAKLASQPTAAASPHPRNRKADDATPVVTVPDPPDEIATTTESAGIWSDQGSPAGTGNGNTNGNAFITMASTGGVSLPLTSPTGTSPTGASSQASSTTPESTGTGVNAAASPGPAAISGKIEHRDATQSHFGFVLLAGGQGGGKLALPSAQLFDPMTTAFAPSTPMKVPRTDHTATVLQSGKIFVAGGDDALGRALSSAELFDPVSGAFSLVGSKMSTARAEHSATLISGCNCPADGQVLIAGGIAKKQGASTASAELYDPVTSKFTPTGSMKAARAMHTATLISSGPLAGEILIAGGIDQSGGNLSSAELYDPASGQFTSTGAMSIPRQGHSATWLDPGNVTGALAGQVLIAGGGDIHAPSNGAEVFNPQNGTFARVGAMSDARIFQAAVLLCNGQVLVAGGQSSETKFLTSAELFNPATASFSPTGSMTNVHVGASATLLESGSVLVAGGKSQLADLYDPAVGTFSATGKMVTDLAESTATLIR